MIENFIWLMKNYIMDMKGNESMLKINDIAPGFEALDQNGTTRNLGEYRGKWLILYFYPRDNTPGCTREACGLKENYHDFEELANVVGVSSDSVQSHKKFAEKYDLPFTLIADPGKNILTQYGADGIIMAKRVTFLIDPVGKIAKIYDKVTPDTHAKQLIEALKQLTSS